MTALAILAFTTLFVTVSPIDVAAIYAALTVHLSPARKRRMAAKAVLVATGILLVIALFGSDALQTLGISLPALQIAGGLLLFLIAVEMVFARHSGVTSTTEAESEEAESRNDISVFPMATPLIAGPGTMGAVILRVAEAHGDVARVSVVIGALLVVMAITYLLLIGAASVSRFLGVTGLNVITRVLGVLLAALAVQFVIDGLRGAGLAG